MTAAGRGPAPRAEARRRFAVPSAVPAYRRYLAGATANNITVWLFQTAISWTILEQTQSATAVGVLFLAWTFPTLFTMVPAGVLVDRIGPRRGMLISQGLSTIAFAAGAALAISGNLTVAAALSLAVVVGALDGFWSSPSLVMAGRIVEPALLPSAMGLSSLTFGAGRIVGGLLGGALVAIAGPAPALVVAAFGPVLAGLMTLTLPQVPGLETARRGTLRDFPDALAWLLRVPAARALVLLGMAVATFGYCYISLLPILTRDLLHSGAGDLGIVTAATGFGIIVGAFTMEAVGRALGRGRTIIVVLLLAAVAFASLGLSHVLPLSMVLAASVAGLLIVFRTTAIALLQALAPGRMRGRVLAIFEIVFWGINPVGGPVGRPAGRPLRGDSALPPVRRRAGRVDDPRGAGLSRPAVARHRPGGSRPNPLHRPGDRRPAGNRADGRC